MDMNYADKIVINVYSVISATAEHNAQLGPQCRRDFFV